MLRCEGVLAYGIDSDKHVYQEFEITELDCVEYKWHEMRFWYNIQRPILDRVFNIEFAIWKQFV
jgi:hypothetical protein